MAYAHSVAGAHELPRGKAEPATSARTRKGLFRRFLDALHATRLQQAEREIARYMALNGGKFTDEVEREIERRFL